MTRDEYEHRKAQIETERRAAVELIERAHQAQLRALELVWLMGGDGAASASALPPWPGLAAAEAAPPAPVPAPAPPPAPRPRQPIGQLWHDVQAAVASLPDTFDTGDVVRALGYAPHRGSLHRELGELRADDEIEVVESGSGRQVTRYRKVPPRQTGADRDPGAATP